MAEEFTEFVVEEVTDSHEVVVQSEPNSAKRRRLPVDRTTEEYRRHRDRNNDAVRRCRQRLQQRNRDRQRMLEDVIEEKAALLTRVMQLTEDIRQLAEAERKLTEDRTRFQELLFSSEKENERLREHSQLIKNEVRVLVNESNGQVDEKKLGEVMEKGELLQKINRLECDLHTANTEKRQLEENYESLKDEMEMWRRRATAKPDEVAPPMIYQIVQTTTAPTEPTILPSS